MEINDISRLTRDINQNNLYDLFIKTYQENPAVPFGSYTVKDEETMRIDLICQKIYSTTEHIDFLLNYNSIDNPLNIMEGDVLICPVSDAITSYRLDEVGKSTTPIEINSAEKSSYVDENRKKFVSQNYNITPTSVTEPQDPVKFIEDKIVISK